MATYPHANLRIDFGPGRKLGPGKVRLLELVEKTGSISAAAREMKMSYRRAWLLIEDLNHIFGKPAVETVSGGTGGGGARLTNHGRSLIEAFRAIESKTAETMIRTLTDYPVFSTASKREP